jgi:formate dehydrogenase major subunit
VRDDEGTLSANTEDSADADADAGPNSAESRPTDQSREPTTTRRGFLAGAGGIAAATTAGLPQPARAAAIPPLRHAGADETTTICPFCGVGCGLVVYTREEGGKKKLIHTEGDSEHPISEGTLCSKGASISQITKNDRRMREVKYRAPGSTEFVTKDWDWALAEIAKRVKKTRDESFERVSGGRTVNRTEAIACLGGAALDNEEAYLLVKAMRIFGLTYIEHQARI